MRNHCSFFVNTSRRLHAFFIITGFFLAFAFAHPPHAEASALLISPTSGTFTVGNTFDVQIFLDTEGKSVNALDVDLRFPPDRLQLVSQGTNVSVIGLWTSQPQFNNQAGRVRLQGGIPGGINVNNALVATLTFKATAVGTAILSFFDTTKVLLNDGFGTDDFSRQKNAVYTLGLPPALGPTVASETHPNQAQWYSNPNVALLWTGSGVAEKYSYIFNEEPIAVPDDRADGNRTSIVYKNVPDGKHYFHIKALQGGLWGGVTHFSVNTDTEPPAGFPLEILPGKRTNARNPLVKFSTTDSFSGIDHYELKLVSLQPQKNENGERGNQSLFVPVESPHVLSTLDVGSYDVFVRAYDKTGNYRDFLNKSFFYQSNFLDHCSAY